MKIVFFNRNDTKIHYYTEPLYVRPLVLIADSVKYISMTAHTVITYKGLEEWTDEMIILAHKEIYKNDEDAIRMHKETDRIFPVIKKVRNIKRKDQRTLIAIQNVNALMRIFKKNLKEYTENTLKGIKMYEVLPFIEEGGFEAQEGWFYSEETKGEDPYINSIADRIAANESIFLFDTQVEQIFSFNPVNSSANKETGFIKIPLWDFPPLADLSYNQMKHTRDNLKPVLFPFKAQLKEFSDELSKTTFASENFSHIEKLYTDKLSPHIALLQKSIEQSMYISQCRNQFSKDIGTKLCLGITSAENLVNYYEKMNIVFPYVANEIKEQLKRRIDMKMTYPFFYFEMNLPETDENNKAENIS